MRAESACTAQELEQVANLREACRASAERFAELPEDDLAGFEALRVCANEYLQALQAILRKPKSWFGLTSAFGTHLGYGIKRPHC